MTFRFISSLAAGMGCLLLAGCAPRSKPPALVTTGTHPMQYWVSLPPDWNPQREWPVVMTIAGSGKEWQQNVEDFARVRDAKRYPFIIVTPLVLSNGGGNLRVNGSYSYDSATWALAAQEKRCIFDLDGLSAVVADVAKQFHGQPRVFLTGFSGGGHTAHMLVLLRPELLRGAAMSAGNYGGRCVFGTAEQRLGPFDDTTKRPISSAPERVDLPIHYFNGTADAYVKNLVSQRDSAIAEERANGYRNISVEMLPGVPHQEMPQPVLAYFFSLLGPRDREAAANP